MSLKTILILGAGRSSAHLIRYLLHHAAAHNWHVRVGDMQLSLAEEKTSGHACASAFVLNANDITQRNSEIKNSDLVISMLPAQMHVEVAKDCLQHGKHLITPSYVSDGMHALNAEAVKKGLLFLNEMGVDPGIDHMSAMQIIDNLKSSGAHLLSFESFTGGLVAPESDNNPWHYKVSWNPRNVVLAGYGGTAQYQEDGELRYIPYHQLFSRITEIAIDGHGNFEGYANRDSLKYKKVYGLENIPGIYRGTLRKGGFCSAWSALVQLGLTDDTIQIENAAQLTWRQLTKAFASPQTNEKLEQAVKRITRANDEVMDKLQWLGIFAESKLGIEQGTPAHALQKLIEEKWKLEENDKDMIVMWHRFRYRLEGKQNEWLSSLVCVGEDPVYTAMSKTVGLPMAIAAKMLLTDKLKLTGVQLPVTPAIYRPIMEELSNNGIVFHEKHIAS